MQGSCPCSATGARRTIRELINRSHPCSRGQPTKGIPRSARAGHRDGYSAAEDKVDPKPFYPTDTTILAGLQGEYAGTPGALAAAAMRQDRPGGCTLGPETALHARHLRRHGQAGVRPEPQAVRRGRISTRPARPSWLRDPLASLQPASSSAVITTNCHPRSPEDMLAKSIGYRLPLAEVEEEILRRNMFQEFLKNCPART